MDKPFVPDAPEDFLYLFLGLLLVSSVSATTSAFTNLDAKTQYALSSPVEFATSSPSEGLTMSKEDLNFLNRASKRSLGTNFVADERLFCFDEVNNRIDSLYSVDDLEDSETQRVSGKCILNGDLQEVNGFIHTQPNNHDGLSEEDMDMESQVDYTCVQYSEISSGLRGSIDGINCWKVSYNYNGEAESFEEIPVSLN